MSHLGKENAFFKRTPNVCLYNRVFWYFLMLLLFVKYKK